MGQKISMDAAAQEYGVSQSTIRRYIAEGRLTAYRIGPHMIRFDADQLDRELCGQQVGNGGGYDRLLQSFPSLATTVRCADPRN